MPEFDMHVHTFLGMGMLNPKPSTTPYIDSFHNEPSMCVKILCCECFQ